MMKNLFLITLGVLFFFTACPTPTGNDNGGGTPDDTPEPEQKETAVVFNNTHGICTVAVYDDHLRQESSKIAEIPAGYSSEKITWPAGNSCPFYFSYFITLNDIDDITVNYTPVMGKDQKTVRVDEGKITDIAIPKLDETLGSSNELLSQNAYVFVQNLSSFSIQMYRTSSPLRPDTSSASSLVNSGEKAVYKLGPGPAAGYSIYSGGDFKNFPSSIVNFETGHIYRFYFDGSAVSFISDKEITLENINVPPILNGAYSFTSWADHDKANTIVLGSHTAKLSGNFWASYNGKTLDSEYRPGTSAIIIWTNKAESAGFQLSVTTAGTSQVIRSVSSSGSVRDFYKE